MTLPQSTHAADGVPDLDWETDPRPLSEVLKSWHSRPGWSRERAASELRVPRPSYNGWCVGRIPQHEAMIRRMMTLIDRSLNLMGAPAVSREAHEISSRWPLTPDQAQTFINAVGSMAEQFVRAAVPLGARTYSEFVDLSRA